MLPPLLQVAEALQMIRAGKPRGSESDLCSDTCPSGLLCAGSAASSRRSLAEVRERQLVSGSLTARRRHLACTASAATADASDADLCSDTEPWLEEPVPLPRSVAPQNVEGEDEDAEARATSDQRYVV